jgi:kanamycin nucleotidyltransferase
MKVTLRDGVGAGFLHDTRMKLAATIVDSVKRKHGKKIAAIGIYGTTAVSCDLPYSDLDMTIVTYEDIDSETKCYSFCGMPIQLDYQTVQDSMETESSVPGEGGCWDSFLVLYDPDGVVGKLRERYHALTDADYAMEFRRRMADHILTYVGKARNAVLGGDRSHLVGSAYQLGIEVCRALGILNRTYITGAMNLVESTKAMEKVPSGFQTLIDVVMGNAAAADQQIYDACEDLWRGMVALSRQNSIDCDLENETVRC